MCMAAGCALGRRTESAHHRTAAARHGPGARLEGCELQGLRKTLMATAHTYAVSERERAIPASMRAAVYHGKNDVRVETVAVPEIGRGEILVRVHTCGICGTDLKKIATGSHSAPRIFGHETAGMVAAVGERVRNFRVGDRV